ncbi:MAG: TetR/AcrR family transcriptional regulator [Chloroflexi bacterium]|nr:TetR/AcrR family transcriptional regulator [Chloroflexota bacterium]
MRAQEINTEARERVLAVAEKLFAQKGYAAVTLRDIATEVGIRHTSLYHHAPGGKEELFIEVTERNLNHHRTGLEQVIKEAKPNIQTQLYAVADWLLSHSPMDLVRMLHSDLPAIAPAQAERLAFLALESLILPVERMLQKASERGEIEHHDLGLVAGGLVGMIESLHAVPDTAFEEGRHGIELRRQTMAYELINVMFNGLRKR